MFEILILTLILLMKIPDHEHVFLFNEKITVHCSFSHDSDEETGERPKPSNREVRYGAPTTKPFIPIIYMLTCPFVNLQIRREAERLRVLLKRKYFGSPPSSRSF
jgi:hypothetical protein